jgi:hypothetical protein
VQPRHALAPPRCRVEAGQAERCGGPRAEQPASVDDDGSCSAGPALRLTMAQGLGPVTAGRTLRRPAAWAVPQEVRTGTPTLADNPGTSRPGARVKGSFTVRCSVPRGSLGGAWRQEKSGAFVVRTRAPRPGREERLSATKNRVRCPNGPLVNVRLTRTGIWRLANRISPQRSWGCSASVARRADAARRSGLPTSPSNGGGGYGSDQRELAWHDEALRQGCGRDQPVRSAPRYACSRGSQWNSCRLMPHLC